MYGMAASSKCLREIISPEAEIILQPHPRPYRPPRLTAFDIGHPLLTSHTLLEHNYAY